MSSLYTIAASLTLILPLIGQVNAADSDPAPVKDTTSSFAPICQALFPGCSSHSSGGKAQRDAAGTVAASAIPVERLEFARSAL